MQRRWYTEMKISGFCVYLRSGLILRGAQRRVGSSLCKSRGRQKQAGRCLRHSQRNPMQLLSVGGCIEEPEGRAADQEEKDKDIQGVRRRLASSFLLHRRESHAQMTAVICGWSGSGGWVVCGLHPRRRCKHKMCPAVGVSSICLCAPADKREDESEQESIANRRADPPAQIPDWSSGISAGDSISTTQ